MICKGASIIQFKWLYTARMHLRHTLGGRARGPVSTKCRTKATIFETTKEKARSPVRVASFNNFVLINNTFRKFKPAVVYSLLRAPLLHSGWRDDARPKGPWEKIHLFKAESGANHSFCTRFALLSIKKEKTSNST